MTFWDNSCELYNHADKSIVETMWGGLDESIVESGYGDRAL